MTEASLAAQKLVRGALAGSLAVVALVPVDNILDRNDRPAPLPSIILGEAQTLADDSDCLALAEIFLTLHCWAREVGLTEVKLIAGAIRRAVRGLEGEADGFHVSLSYADARFLRDPDGETSHAVVTLQGWAEEV